MAKKLIQINTVCNGSTGTIMGKIQEASNKAGYQTLSFYGRRKGYNRLYCKKFGNLMGFWMHVIWATITDRQGLGSYFSTKKMVGELRRENPDIIHLHNLHGYYLNYLVLFRYLKEEYSGKIVWTFHDCWPITGHCPYFVLAKCDKWKVLCSNCPNKKLYPTSWFWDSSEYNYKLKKSLFSGVENMTIICPSQWMADKVRQSFLKDIKVEVVYNGIDLDIFFPRKNIFIKNKYSISKDKKIILGVANVWDKRKGLDVFKQISKELSQTYVIVLVGLKKNQINRLPSQMIGIERTENQNELAELYSIANIFLNPSEEESFSLVTAEAMACGTPVIVLDSSAVKELVNEEVGMVLHEPNTFDYIKAIRDCQARNWDREKIRRNAEKFNVYNMTKNILNIYNQRDDVKS